MWRLGNAKYSSKPRLSNFTRLTLPSEPTRGSLHCSCPPTYRTNDGIQPAVAESFTRATFAASGHWPTSTHPNRKFDSAYDADSSAKCWNTKSQLGFHDAAYMTSHVEVVSPGPALDSTALCKLSAVSCSTSCKPWYLGLGMATHATASIWGRGRQVRVCYPVQLVRAPLPAYVPTRMTAYCKPVTRFAQPKHSKPTIFHHQIKFDTASAREWALRARTSAASVAIAQSSPSLVSPYSGK